MDGNSNPKFGLASLTSVNPALYYTVVKDGCLNPGVVHPELGGEVDPERQETHYPVVEEEEGGSVHKQIQQHKHSFKETVSLRVTLKPEKIF